MLTLHSVFHQLVTVPTNAQLLFNGQGVSILDHFQLQQKPFHIGPAVLRRCSNAAI